MILLVIGCNIAILTYMYPLYQIIFYFYFLEL